MKNAFAGFGWRAGVSYIAILGAAIFGLASMAPSAFAQMPGPGGSGGVTNQIGMGASGGLGDSLAYGTQGDRQQRDRYAAFQALAKENDPKQKILKGREFLQRDSRKARLKSRSTGC